jgi:hypothetical protein
VARISPDMRMAAVALAAYFSARKPPRTPPAAPDFRGQSVAIFRENSFRVEGAVCAGVADMEHDNGYAKVVECVHIDWHKPEGAIAILYREFRRAAQRCLANKWRRVRFDIQSHHIRSERRFLNAGAPGKRECDGD